MSLQSEFDSVKKIDQMATIAMCAYEDLKGGRDISCKVDSWWRLYMCYHLNTTQQETVQGTKIYDYIFQ